MTVTNHMMTGGLIAVLVERPVLAIPLAFVSHFIADMVPHYGYGDVPFHERDSQKHFLRKQVFDTYFALGLFWIVPYVLGSLQTPLVTMLCMLAAAMPDSYWAFQYAIAQRRGKYRQLNRYARFHKAIQWYERPWGIYVELVWFIGIIIILQQLVT